MCHVKSSHAFRTVKLLFILPESERACAREEAKGGKTDGPTYNAFGHLERARYTSARLQSRCHRLPRACRDAEPGCIQMQTKAGALPILTTDVGEAE